jgi:hypothetical protein
MLLPQLSRETASSNRSADRYRIGVVGGTRGNDGAVAFYILGHLSVW